VHVLPVIDLKAGQVVRGVGGRRELYQAVVSCLAPDSTPGSIARAFAERFGFTAVYVADLDAIGGAEPNWRALQQIAAVGLHLWIDAGVSNREQANRLASFSDGIGPPPNIVIGLESVDSPATLATLFNMIGQTQRAVFSLDLKDLHPLTDSSAWEGMSALEIAKIATQIGFRQIIVLDLARVGMQQGTGIEPVCRQLRQFDPQLHITAGGGIRGLADLKRLASAGCNAALVASALHDGHMTKANIDAVVDL
jgi:phosphoribosylformimino-5-aminoimidazole carboxamide ribotide isomerase